MQRTLATTYVACDESRHLVRAQEWRFPLQSRVAPRRGSRPDGGRQRGFHQLADSIRACEAILLRTAFERVWEDSIPAVARDAATSRNLAGA
jgi:hypothetical protein